MTPRLPSRRLVSFPKRSVVAIPSLQRPGEWSRLLPARRGLRVHQGRGHGFAPASRSTGALVRQRQEQRPTRIRTFGMAATL